MKKLIYSAMAATMLLATSCQDDMANSFVGEEATVEFNISTPEIATRAYSVADEIDHLHYAVYEEDGTITQLTATEVPFDKLGKSLSLKLKTGKTYQVVFWADDENAPYFIDFENKRMSIVYTNQNQMVCNNEKLDAFYYSGQITVEGNKTIGVTLTRPFAQINVVTNDYEDAKKANYIPTQSEIKVKSYTTLNLWDGSVYDEKELTYAYSAIPTEDFISSNISGYKYIAMSYVLMGSNEAVDVTFSHKNNKDESVRTVGAVPLARNYRTNLYGSLLTSDATVNVGIEAAFVNDYDKEVPKVVEVATADDLQTAIANPNVGQVVLTDDIEMLDILVIGAPSNNSAPTRSGAVAASRNLVIDGNGKTLKSNAARAINVSGVDGVTIKNLTIEASGERAINIIQNATNVTIEDVTATAANYTVNVASSAPYAEVAIKNSTLNGLCTVNVSAAGANVTVDGSTINCNDNNTTAGEAYAALSLNKDAVGGKIIATNTTVNVTEGSDSTAGRNGAENGVVTIDGLTDGVVVMVAAITYPGSDYYYSFQTLQDAIDFAKENGGTITLIRDITMNAEKNSGYGKAGIVVDEGITIDGNDKKLTVNGAWTTWDCAIAAKKGTIKNLTVSGAMRGIFMPGATGDVYIDNVIFDNVIYTFNSDAGNKEYGVYISNSTLNGWTSHSDVHKEVVYTNCSFGEGNGYAFCRPYGPTTFAGCDFAAGFEVDAIGAVTFEKCTIGGVALTEGNLATLVIDGIGNATVK